MSRWSHDGPSRPDSPGDGSGKFAVWRFCRGHASRRFAAARPYHSHSAGEQTELRPVFDDHPRALVYHHGGLGDFITTLPAIACRRLQYPGDRLCFLGRGDHGELARDALLVDEALDADRGSLSLLFVQEHPKALSWLSGFRRALLFTSSNSPLVHNLTACGCPSITVQNPFPDSRQPKVHYHLSLFKSPPPVQQLLQALRNRVDAVPLSPAWGDAESLRRAVVIHPGSGSPRKNWPLERYVTLAKHLGSHGAPVIWCLGPAESGLRPGPGRVVRDLPLIELAGLLRRVRCFIGNDGGVAHLAAAVGCSSLVLFGPTDEVVWRPVGAPVTVVMAPGEFSESRSVEKIDLDHVLSTIGGLAGEGASPALERLP